MPKMSEQEMLMHSILAPKSWGCGLSPAMKLVAIVIGLWRDHMEVLTGGRESMDLDEIADRCGMTAMEVDATLARLEKVNLVARHADGWRLTWDLFMDTARKHWSIRDHVRPAV